MEENTNIETLNTAPTPQKTNIPYNYTPISAWGYVGYQLLFCVPLVGFIFMLVWAFNNNNINRRNFARSYLIFLIAGIIIGIIIAIIIILIAIIGGGISSSYIPTRSYYY